jgi:hypothetical protein
MGECDDDGECDDPFRLVLAASYEAATAPTNNADANMTWKTSSHPVISATTKNADTAGERWWWWGAGR